MRGHKRERSVLNISRLIAYYGNNLSKGLNLAIRLLNQAFSSKLLSVGLFPHSFTNFGTVTLIRGVSAADAVSFFTGICNKRFC
jgi:hypothetical protein